MISILHQPIRPAEKSTMLTQILHHTKVVSFLPGPGQVYSTWAAQCSTYISSPGTHQVREQKTFKDGVYQMAFFFPRLEVKHAGRNSV